MAALVRDVIAVLEARAPLELAEAWDNVGLLAGDPSAPARKVGLTIDLTPEVARELTASGCDLVVAYHPPIFKPIRRIAPGSGLALVLRAGAALYTPHTALDAAEGGTNDVLLDVLGVAADAGGRRVPLRPVASADRELKLVTFVPAEKVDAVAGALFDAGAGRIGDYSACSFRIPGTGTFYGEAGASPAVGEAGRLERVDEVRIETVLPSSRAGDVVRALMKAHPYETPAFDLVRLAAPPQAGGAGRSGDLPAPVERAELLVRIKAGLGVERLLVAGPTTGAVQRVATAAGAAGELLGDAIRAGAGLFLTGEVRHHDALAAPGITIVAALHSNSERRTLARVAGWIREGSPGLDVHIAASDRDPFTIV
jgi:dinuclear metal center YbgI/SA1388 family protein